MCILVSFVALPVACVSLDRNDWATLSFLHMATSQRSSSSVHHDICIQRGLYAKGEGVAFASALKIL